VDGLIYKEVARDRLNDPLATLIRRRCQFLTRAAWCSFGKIKLNLNENTCFNSISPRRKSFF
jgi:hypothetical protein